MCSGVLYGLAAIQTKPKGLGDLGVQGLLGFRVSGVLFKHAGILNGLGLAS